MPKANIAIIYEHLSFWNIAIESEWKEYKVTIFYQWQPPDINNPCITQIYLGISYLIAFCNIKPATASAITEPFFYRFPALNYTQPNCSAVCHVPKGTTNREEWELQAGISTLEESATLACAEEEDAAAAPGADCCSAWNPSELLPTANPDSYRKSNLSCAL